MTRKAYHAATTLVVAAFAIGGAWVAASALAASGSHVVGLRRLTENEYRNSIADIFGKDISVQGTFEPGIRLGGLTAASTAVLSITPAGFESYSKMADSIATQATAEENRKRLSANGTVVYLRARPEDLYERVRHDRNRPLLATADPLGRLAELYEQRDPLYRSIADLTVDTGAQGVPALARQLLMKLEEKWKASA